MDARERFAQMAEGAKTSIEEFNDFADDRAIAWAAGEIMRLTAERDRYKTALADMVALWDRVHGGAIVGRPTVNAAKKLLS